jgi:putative hydrolase of the HAD superfamily
MKVYHHIFFDLDRTLWDFQKNSSETLMDIIEKFSLRSLVKDDQLFIEKFNFFNDHLWDHFQTGKIKKIELRKERFRLLMAFFEVKNDELTGEISRYYLNTTPRKTALLPGAKEILEYLCKKYRLYIISNGFYDVQLTKMISSGISRYFQKTFTSDQIGLAKPKTGMFNFAVSTVNARKDESLMVGDDVINDIQGASNAKIDQVYFNPDGLPSPVKPTYEIKKLAELRNFL